MLLLAIGLADWKSTGLLRYLSCLVIALFFSTLKVHVQGLTGTLSFSFTFVLIGVADFSFAETLVMACASGFVQSRWKRRPPAVQLWFAVATATVSAGPAWLLPRLLLNLVHVESTVVLLVLAAPLYFTINNSLVAAIVALVEEKPVKALWKHCSFWSYAWFSLQTIVAGLVVMLTRSHALLVLCGVVLFFVFKLGRKPLVRLLSGRQDVVGRKTKRYEGVHSSLEMIWRDREGKGRVLTAQIVDISEWGARVACMEPVSIANVHVKAEGSHAGADGSAYDGLASVCYCRFENGKYVIGLEFHRCLTRNELMSFLLTRDTGVPAC